ncbi:probable pectinesterase/pectinesterase inhibitor 35 [Mercurialis annua]|uniref:probable pectinesterase/pectinesterase inhibitor 35 n=1 Tax=Mercurialis annua TaxID=3986 RepID=UPI00215DFD24|nr:probable pectinesterase/pectinesterase inhibitor 35 [Mercurialis annua]
MCTMPRISFPHAKSSHIKTVFSFSLLLFCLASIAESSNSQFSKLSRSSSQSSDQPSPKQLFDHSVHHAFEQVHSALELASIVTVSRRTNTAAGAHLTGGPGGGMVDCVELLDDSLDLLSNTINRKNNPKYTNNDVQTWLSAALTDQQTCIQSLQNDKLRNKLSGNKGQEMIPIARNLSQHISNSLALYMSHHYNNEKRSDNKGGGRKLLLEEKDNKFPAWVSEAERRLLETPAEEIKADAVVAVDGSGTHTSIGEAIAEVMSKYSLAGEGGGGRNVIYVKAGTYHENLKLSKKETNVMLMGDGKGKSVIVGSRSADEGWSTFQTATVSVMGDGFIAKGITFVNSAGPNKHQAVALRVASDKSVIYQCSLQANQDTLYTHSKRQFYRDTDIYGTIDFIFGNSAVVFQNCNIFAKKPSGIDRNYVTAQGRTDPNQNTGITIHNCKITSESGGKGTYLGRPWQKFARVIVMQSFLDGSINPAGWYPWSGSFALSTLFYAEYMNSGPGSSVSGRVKWPGYKGNLSPASAQTFTVSNFIDGNMWLPSTGVSFDSGLIG